jgi:MFS family permease
MEVLRFRSLCGGPFRFMSCNVNASDSRLPVIGETAAVWLFGLTQIVGYGTTYYSFAILADGMAADLQITRAMLFGVFSLALVLSGLASPFAGRLMDQRGASQLMGPGSVVAGLFLAAAAMSHSLASFAIAMAVVQVAGAVILYEAAFVALVQASGRNGQRRIIQLTLIAGFASTIFWPLTQWLEAAWGWRNVFLLYAGLNIIVCAPIHYLIGQSHHHRRQSGTPLQSPPLHQPLPAADQNRALWLVTTGFLFSSVALSATLAQLVPMLQTLGLGSAALAVASIFGPAQVVIRFLNLVIAMDRHPIAITLLLSGLLLVAVLVLMMTAPSIIGAAVFVALLGCFSGLKSISQGALPLALFGAQGYGARLGAISLFRLVPAALAPFGFAWLLDHAGSTAALSALCLAAVISFAAFTQIARMLRRV